MNEKKKLNILVIDDDHDIREMVCDMLVFRGYNVLQAADGNEGMRIVRNVPQLDLIITDIVMPEKEGIETIRELKRDFPDIKILAISGGGRGDAMDYLAIAKKIGASGILRKPFVRKTFFEEIDKLISG